MYAQKVVHRLSIGCPKVVNMSSKGCHWSSIGCLWLPDTPRRRNTRRPRRKVAAPIIRSSAARVAEVPGPRCWGARCGAGLAMRCRLCAGVDAVVAAGELVARMRGIVHVCDMLWTTPDLALRCVASCMLFLHAGGRAAFACVCLL